MVDGKLLASNRSIFHCRWGHSARTTGRMVWTEAETYSINRQIDVDPWIEAVMFPRSFHLESSIKEVSKIVRREVFTIQVSCIYIKSTNCWTSITYSRYSMCIYICAIYKESNISIKWHWKDIRSHYFAFIMVNPRNCVIKFTFRNRQWRMAALRSLMFLMFEPQSGDDYFILIIYYSFNFGQIIEIQYLSIKML